jgi:phosphopantetheinyl transferase
MLPAFISCESGEVQLRWSCLDDFSQKDISGFFKILTPEEKAKVHAAKTETEQKIRTVSRGILRQELALRTGISPHLIQLETNFSGKPTLARFHATDLKFNLSHSHNWLIHAFANGFDLGVDIEHINSYNVNLDLLMKMNKTNSTKVQLTEGEHISRFFHQWVLQEAILKAKGLGIIDLDNMFEEMSNRDSEPWQVIPLQAPLGFAAALAVPKTFSLIKCSA